MVLLGLFHLEFSLDDLDDIPEQPGLSAAFKVLDKSLSLKSLGAQRYLLRISMGRRVLRKNVTGGQWRRMKKMTEEDGCLLFTSMHSSFLIASPGVLFFLSF